MAETAAVQVGIAAAIYRNAGSYGSPTWTEITLARNSSLSRKWKYGDASIRATKATLNAKTQLDITGQIECRADPADAGYQALFDAANSDSASAPDIMILDGDIATEGVKGIRAHLNLDEDQDHNIDGVVYGVFDFNCAWHSAGYPSKVEMGAASSPTFTAF